MITKKVFQEVLVKNAAILAELCISPPGSEILPEQVEHSQRRVPDSSAVKPTLLVVDMQPEVLRFLSVLFIEKVAFEIRQACNNNHSVLFLESEDDSHTISGLLNIPAEKKGFGRFARVIKYGSNGALEVIDACMVNDFKMEHIRVCGVFGNSCVFETVSGLSRSLPNARIDVVESACDRSILEVSAKLALMANVCLV
jgi:hypothetical protein